MPYSISEAVITGEAHVLWKGPQGNIVLPGSKYSVRLITSHDTGESGGTEKLKASTLALVDCRETDAGRYTCAVVVAASNENLHCVTAYLHVLRKFFTNKIIQGFSTFTSAYPLRSLATFCVPLCYKFSFSAYPKYFNLHTPIL